MKTSYHLLYTKYVGFFLTFFSGSKQLQVILKRKPEFNWESRRFYISVTSERFHHFSPLQTVQWPVLSLDSHGIWQSFGRQLCAKLIHSLCVFVHMQEYLETCVLLFWFLGKHTLRLWDSQAGSLIGECFGEQWEKNRKKQRNTLNFDCHVHAGATVPASPSGRSLTWARQLFLPEGDSREGLPAGQPIGCQHFWELMNEGPGSCSREGEGHQEAVDTRSLKSQRGWLRTGFHYILAVLP